ncbi:hypothetical protein [Paraburkholderia tropica]|uniref:hypothetical protein n=1 Tax=Paraburkholderia tropica TaxID=92647 RepID=UPI002AB7B6B5|nr:hypothetical protein [Paraburkholderia tropica]
MSTTQARPSIHVREKILRIAAAAALLISFIVVIPFQPWFAEAPGLDLSWAFAMNDAVARHLAFGRDVVFTFGPWASVYTTLYHPATDNIMLLGSGIAAAAICLGFSLLLLDRNPVLLLILPIAIVLSARDTILFLIPMLVLLVAARLSAPKENTAHLEMTSWRKSAFLFCAAAAGTLPLVKGSFAGLAFGEVGFAFVLLCAAGLAPLAFSAALSAGAALCLGWIWSGQQIADLPHFFVAQAPIISGYSEAMSVQGPAIEIVVWLITSAVALAVLGISQKRTLRHAVLWVGFAFYLFVLFKAGFVRQDGHQKMNAASLPFISIALVPFVSRVSAKSFGALAAAVWLLFATLIGGLTPLNIAQRLHLAQALATDGIARRLAKPEYFPAAFDEGVAKIRAAEPVTDVTGTTDVYPTDLSMLFANGIQWDGRPVLQSYSAYTLELDHMNAAHLSGTRAPQNVLMSPGPIDGRFPMSEDARSMVALLDHYTPVGGVFTYLKLQPSASRGLHEVALSQTMAKMGQTITVPQAGIVIATLDITPTPLGRVALTALKLPYVRIKVVLANGAHKTYRIVPSMAKSGFILSPLVEVSQDFKELYVGGNRAKRVASIEVMTSEVGLWNRDFSVKFSALEVSANGTR